MLFIKKIKYVLYNFKKNFKKREKIKEEIKKDTLDIEKLPEKINNSIKLDKIITFGFIFRTGIIILFLAYIGYIAINSLNIIYTIFTAFIISLALENTISFFSRFIPRGFSIIISYILFFLFLIFGFVIFIPFILEYFSEIFNIIVLYFEKSQNILENEGILVFIQSFHLPGYIENKLLIILDNTDIANKIENFIVANISSIVQNFTEYVKNISSFAINIISSFFTIISQIIIVFVLSIFFSFEKDKVVYTIATLSQTPKYTALKLAKLYSQLGEWLKGQILLGLFIGLTVYFGLFTLSLFGISLESKGTLALIAGFMEFIPYLGPILGAIPALIVASLNFGITGFISILILFIIIQQIEGLIVPIVMNKALGISPLLIFIAMLIGLQVMGLVGIILAIPLAVIISLFFEDYLDKK